MSPMPALAQAQLTAADIQRLQDSAFDATTDLGRLRQRDARLAESLERELDDLRDEVIYLKVKMRKTGATRAEYSDLRDRIDQLRSQIRGDAAPASSSSSRTPVADERISPTEIPVGTEFDVRLQSRLNSGTARVEDRFDATTIVPYERNGRVLVPAGSVMRGVVNAVTPASRGVNRKGELTLVFDRFSIDGRTYSVRATVHAGVAGRGRCRPRRSRCGRRRDSSAPFSAGLAAHLPGFSSAAAGQSQRPRAMKSISRRAPCCGSGSTRRWMWLSNVGRVRIVGRVGTQRISQSPNLPISQSSSLRGDLFHCFARGFDGLVDVARGVRGSTGTTLRIARAAGRCRARACP